MLDGKRVVVVTPAGRRRYMAILVRHVLRLRPAVDEYRVWVNTDVPEDVAYLESLESAHPGFVTVERLPEGASVRGNESICHFFRNCVDPDTVYVRFDDDIVYVDSRDAFEGFVRHRLSTPGPLLVYANILNNAVISYVHQRAGTLALGGFELAYHCTESPGWADPECAAALHEEVLPALESAAGSLERFRLPGFNPSFGDYERVSINCISWLGSDFAAFGGEVGTDEELWLSCTKPAAAGRPNALYGGFVVVHFAFHTQRAHLELSERQPGALHRYAALAGVPADEVVLPDAILSRPPSPPPPPPPILGRRRILHGIVPAALPRPPAPGTAPPHRMLAQLDAWKASYTATAAETAAQTPAAANSGAT